MGIVGVMKRGFASGVLAFFTLAIASVLVLESSGNGKLVTRDERNIGA